MTISEKLRLLLRAADELQIQDEDIVAVSILSRPEFHLEPESFLRLVESLEITTSEIVSIGRTEDDEFEHLMFVSEGIQFVTLDPVVT